MMSDLADIAAAAGIAIVDAPLHDGGDMSHSDSSKQTILSSAVVPDGSGDLSLVHELETLEGLYDHRYTEEDPSYAKTVSESSAMSRPPCVEGYFGRRQRDNSRPWQRGRNHGDHYRDGRGHRGRGDYNYHGNRPRHESYDNYRSRDRGEQYHNRDGDRYQRDRSPRRF